MSGPAMLSQLTNKAGPMMEVGNVGCYEGFGDLMCGEPVDGFTRGAMQSVPLASVRENV